MYVIVGTSLKANIARKYESLVLYLVRLEVSKIGKVPVSAVNFAFIDRTNHDAGVGVRFVDKASLNISFE